MTHLLHGGALWYARRAQQPTARPCRVARTGLLGVVHPLILLAHPVRRGGSSFWTAYRCLSVRLCGGWVMDSR